MRIPRELLVLVVLPLASAQSVTTVPFTESNHAIRAFSPDGDITLSVVKVQIEIQYPARKHERGSLVVAYDPSSGYYFWRYSRLVGPGAANSFLDTLQSGIEAVYIGPEGLTDFYMPGELYEQEHREKANTLADAESAALEAIRRGLPVFENTGYHTDAKEIQIAELGRDFACEQPPRDAICGGELNNRIASVSRQGVNWRLVLRNRFDQEIVLSREFSVNSSKRLNKSAQ